MAVWSGCTALALTAAACGSSGADTTAAAPTVTASETSDAEAPVTDAGADTDTDEPSSDAAVPDLSNYPALAVTDVSSGETVELASVIAASETPVLLWFWAPH